MISVFKSIRAYELIAFTTGFSLMAYELAAARILAPSIGSSTYVWTSVIGVIIAALSLGYAVGGSVADKRVRPEDVAWLLLASASGVLLTLVFAPGTLASLQSIADPRLQGLLASLLLFMPASFVLGAIAPYLARLRTEGLAHTGRVVASLSAMNAIGGIAGTFCVGFVLFGFIGSRETMIVVVTILAGSSWLIAPLGRLRWRAALTVWITAVGILLLATQPPTDITADIDTPSARYQVMDRNIANATVRILATGPMGSQSGVYANGSRELVFGYTKRMAEVIAQAPHKGSMLVLGGGAFTLPAYLADTYPNSSIDVVEIDPQLTAIAKKYFGYYDRPNVRIVNQDARAFLNTNQKKYDLILVDVYSDTAVPFAVTTRNYAQHLARSTSEHGAAIVNVIGADTRHCAPLLRSVHQSYMTAFSSAKSLPLRDHTFQTVQNIIFVYGQDPLSWLHAPDTQLEKSISLTDNFAPIERLQQQCLSHRG